MATTYTKSFSSDFGSSLETSQLKTEIDGDGGIAPTLLRIDRDNDDIDIVFNTSLSAGEQTTLNGLVSAHTPATPVGARIMNMTINSLPIEDTEYVTVAFIQYPGSNIWSDITHIKVVSSMEEGGTSYDMKVHDMSNNAVIVSKNCTNTDDEICDLGTISNVPASSAMWELQCKINGTSVATVNSLSIYYD